MAAPRKNRRSFGSERSGWPSSCGVTRTHGPALKRVGDQLGINSETLRNWVQQAEVHEGHRPGVTTAEAKRIAELEREVKELRRANEILRTAA
jgi:transposase